MAAVSRDGAALECAKKHLKGDREIVLQAVSGKGLALQFASEDRGFGHCSATEIQSLQPCNAPREEKLNDIVLCRCGISNMHVQEEAPYFFELLVLSCFVEVFSRLQEIPSSASLESPLPLARALARGAQGRR